MNGPARLLSCVLLVVGLIAGACLTMPGWSGSAGVDFWSLPDLHAQIDDHSHLSIALDAKHEEVLQSIERKEWITDQVIAGRMSLAAAARRFRDLSIDRPGFMKGARSIYPGSTDEEIFCQSVIAHVRAQLHYRPLLAAIVAARLKEEMDALRDEHGVVGLPERDG